MILNRLSERGLLLAFVMIIAVVFAAIAYSTDLAVYNTLRYTEEGLYQTKPTYLAGLNLITFCPRLFSSLVYFDAKTKTTRATR